VMRLRLLHNAAKKNRHFEVRGSHMRTVLYVGVPFVFFPEMLSSNGLRLAKIAPCPYHDTSYSKNCVFFWFQHSSAGLVSGPCAQR
jgi:hypothetical protein